MCHGQKSRFVGDGHPTFNRDPYNGYINPYYWVDDHPLLYGNNGRNSDRWSWATPWNRDPLFFGQIPVWHQKFHQGHYGFSLQMKWQLTMIFESQNLSNWKHFGIIFPKKNSAQFHQHDLDAFFALKGISLHDFGGPEVLEDFFGGEHFPIQGPIHWSQQKNPETQGTSHPHQVIPWCFLAHKQNWSMKLFWLVVEPPIWKICSSNWKSSPNRGDHKTYLKPPPSLGRYKMIRSKLSSPLWKKYWWQSSGCFLSAVTIENEGRLPVDSTKNE